MIQESCLLVLAQQKDQESFCALRQNCKSCIQTPQCVWCSASGSGLSRGPIGRCVTREKFEKEKDLWCSNEMVIQEASTMNVLDSKPLMNAKGREPVQIQPQRIRLRLRLGEESRIEVKYSQAEDYPVDLYYLMDLSASMEKYKDQLSELGFRLAEAMSKLTSNFRLGFGSFVDKVVLPMTYRSKDRVTHQCILSSGKPCAPPYGYKNQMPLTENVALFKQRVKDAPVSGNLDAPEGGLDAMMQAMVCAKEIGWREKARHLLVFSTDAGFHIAGDGRLAGIIEPNDGLCHLDTEGFYNYSLLQDYPSISQVNRKARENNVNVIFAVPNYENETYQLLSQRISGSAIGLLEKDSKNVVALVSGEYEKLVNSVTMTDNAPRLIDIKYYSKCLNAYGELKERKECGGLRVEDVVKFEVALKATECPDNSKEWTQIVQIKPEGISESLVIEVEVICDCPCARPGHPGYIPDAEECKGNGTMICGVCSCSEGFYGKQCECKVSDVKEEKSSVIEDCKPSNETDEICSGRGTCKCGVCDCVKRVNPQEMFYGKYCECDNFSCKRSGGLVCGGRGKCECGTCNCLPSWGGETCDCKETNSTCTLPGEDAEICSGRGDCICGTCHCHEKDKIRYSGQYCEECPTCPGKRCEELKDCVECKAYKSGPLAINRECDSCLHQVDITDKIEDDPTAVDYANAHICRAPAEGGCTFAFKYEHYRGGTGGDIKIFKITAQKKKDCPVPVNVLGVAVGVIIGTVILGFLILLVWKILTTIHDRREYAKFERQRALAKWDRGDNPLYKQATSTFKNPTFSEYSKMDNN
ncbi:integrin beta-PS isoform X2 [Orussus abietinus]|uniref:integrin beta-PS isoform X2 n=1 Tax=Orussus abietinus TaxID=222816 RepID=UPI0006262245|nr:integrin beta-PS isoform X2 [Orussus abietinus]